MTIIATLLTPERVELTREDGHTAWVERFQVTPTERWSGGVDGGTFRTVFESRGEAISVITDELAAVGWRERMAEKVAKLRAER